MILTVTVNPCVDKSSSVEKIEPDSKLRCSAILNEPGGGGINVSKALKKLGLSGMALFPAGGHNGNMLIALLEAGGIPFHAIDTNTETRENWVMMTTKSHQQYRFTFPGLAIEEDKVNQLISALRPFRPSFVVASGSLPVGLPASFYGSIVDEASICGARCIVDTSGPALKALKGKKTYLVKPNIGELCSLLDAPRLEKAEVPAAALRAIDEGYAEMIAVSMGADGAWLVSKAGSYFCEVPEVDKRSTVGAGDSMVAGMLYMLQQNATPEEVLKFGVACGTAATMNEGTQLFNKDDAFRLFHEMGGSPGIHF